jgi:ferredoxin, 2Fe-2S
VAGVNPYLKNPPPPKPTKAYTLTLKNTGQRFTVDPAALADELGQDGSVLATLLANGVDIDHACGGVLACSTCHIYVRKGGDSANESTDEEEDMLDSAPALHRTSRLACQCVPSGAEDVEVEIPAWTRNEVKEGH